MTTLRYAKKFAAFNQSQYLGNIAVTIDVVTQQFTQLAADPKGICYGLCCSWMKEIKQNRSYMLDKDNFSTRILQASENQKGMSSRFDYSNCDNDLILQGIGQVTRKDGIPFNNPKNMEQALDDFAASDKANFLVIILDKPNWAHAVVAKLNQSVTGGWLNFSYPCAFFDPNIGQGMYNNHSDLAADIQAIAFGHYNVTSVRGYTIKCSSMN